VPKTHLGPDYGEYPRLDVKASQPWPDLKLTPAMGLDGIVVDGQGQRVVGADVYILAPDGPRVRRREPNLTGADATFHFDALDPDDKLSLWARRGDATTAGAVVVRPKEVMGNVTLTIDPKDAVILWALVVT
jgi:hypothetical protein